MKQQLKVNTACASERDAAYMEKADRLKRRKLTEYVNGVIAGTMSYDEVRFNSSVWQIKDINERLTPVTPLP